MTNMQYNHS